MFLGIDGGGTKTEMILTTDLGKVISRVVGPGTNPGGITKAELFINLQTSLKKLFADICDVSDFRGYVFAGISGAGLLQNREKLSDVFHDLLPNATGIKIQSDSVNVVSAALGDKDGVIVISGTGSCVYAKKGEVLKRFGGWGYLLEDPASAYELGKNALKILLEVEEGLREKSILSDSVRKLLGYDCDSNLGKIYELGKPYIASFAPAVTSAAQAGCPEALAIIDTSCNLLSKQIDAAIEFVGSKTVNIAFAGSVFEKTEIVKLNVIGKLTKEVSVLTTPKPVVGAVLQAAFGLIRDNDKRELFKENLNESLLEIIDVK